MDFDRCRRPAEERARRGSLDVFVVPVTYDRFHARSRPAALATFTFFREAA